MRQAALVLCLLLGLQLPAHAQAVNNPQATIDRLCTIDPPAEDVFVYTIDLTNGFTQGKSRYKVDDEVQIVFKDKNPFVYDYNFKIEALEVPEPALETFFRAFNTSPTATLLNLAQVASPRIAREAPECATRRQTLATRETRYLASFNRLKQLGDETVTKFKQVRADVASEENDLKQQPDCAALVREALEVPSLIQSALDETQPGQLGERWKQFRDELGRFEAELRDQAQEIEVFKRIGCSGAESFETHLRAARERLESENPPGLRKIAGEFEAAAKELATKAEKINDVLQSRDNFIEAQQVGDFDTLTEVTITVERGQRPAAPGHFLTKKLRFGGRQRFALGAGAAFSPMDLQTYTAVQGTKLVNNVPTATRVVGFGDDSEQRVAPLMMLHTRFTEKWWIFSGTHFSFGFAGQFGDDGANLEYLVGFSASLAEERLFLTVGTYNGRVEKLENGFAPGMELPASITEPPVSRSRDWDLGLAVTYKFR